FQFETPYSLRTVSDEGFISFLALSDVPHRPRTFDRFPATVSDSCYQIDFFSGPAARCALVDCHSGREVSVLLQRHTHKRSDLSLPVKRQVGPFGGFRFDVIDDVCTVLR